MLLLTIYMKLEILRKKSNKSVQSQRPIKTEGKFYCQPKESDCSIQFVDLVSVI